MSVLPLPAREFVIAPGVCPPLPAEVFFLPPQPCFMVRSYGTGTVRYVWANPPCRLVARLSLS